jgi:hypothetical protein
MRTAELEKSQQQAIDQERLRAFGTHGRRRGA